MEPFLFRKIASNEVDTVHALYADVFEWLKRKGIRQWLTFKPRCYFEEFRRKGQLHGLFAGSELVVFAALVAEKPPHWADEIDIAEGAWVHRLTLNRRFRGHGHGARMVGQLIALARKSGASHICLDAVDVNDTMPAYYEKLGFRRRKTANVTYPNGNTFPVVFLDISFLPVVPAAGSRLRCPGYEERKI